MAGVRVIAVGERHGFKVDQVAVGFLQVRKGFFHFLQSCIHFFQIVLLVGLEKFIRHSLGALKMRIKSKNRY